MTSAGKSTAARGAMGVLALAVSTLAGCGDVDTRPAEWSFIAPAIVQPNCATASCHSPAASASGLDFSNADRGYASLTRLTVAVVSKSDAGVAADGGACEVSGGTTLCGGHPRPLVTPYDPAGSRLVNTLRARFAPRMPPDRPLPEAEIRLVEKWILNGACRDGRSCTREAAADGPSDGGATSDQRTGG